MSKMVGTDVCVAIAEAAKLANIDVVAAYPITPQSHIVEHLADLVANGKLDAEYIPVESEHSAMSACLGSSAAGARTFTATAGQGLELMHEVVYVTSSMRLPMVMVVTNRALSAPLSIWGDHSDAMSVGDTGWIQIFVENGQQAVDNVLCSFRIGEDQRVLLPVMVHVDGFHLTHMVEPIIFPEQSEVEQFLPSYHHPLPLDPDKPVTMGAFAQPNIFTETKKAQYENFKASKKVILECWDEFGKRFGRQYHPVEGYRNEDANILLLTMGSYSETAMSAVDELRTAGKKVGLIRLRLWRPFPFEEVRQAVSNADILIVLDRAISIGGSGGPVCSLIKLALYHEEKKPRVASIIGGLGGRDISVTDFEELINRGIEIAKKGRQDEIELFGVRE
ncbi:MAG: pyruvate ferredoxin oxidoreductase [Dehalococcoidales bacterium]|jgi:pyruvate ferredoxin oxidoreductase alpha subunit|nr:pyruvate ferredoxin oxidoreductase [Dehalococcoidales bacterium]MDP6221510.1 transketolase C-terminal domain-containing protein [Dehalococcoidales bacterium]MDP7109965.1 transketolase C-terminal domain-containing protein [Dehalococcoidales bacterium]MDP7309746.1 transketolase C-terminal domain-containing protein [Dehalococcoidales bacterium]MDP7409321.1 transketolase C-terminal domain-containing protein [Dehalococcoidales bacterium]|tara:strand:+ start:3040 stop:4215 length:1176 start_codon:yes stop_codon:yes gene_type:complete